MKRKDLEFTLTCWKVRINAEHRVLAQMVIDGRPRADLLKQAKKASLMQKAYTRYIYDRDC